MTCDLWSSHYYLVIVHVFVPSLYEVPNPAVAIPIVIVAAVTDVDNIVVMGVVLALTAVALMKSLTMPVTSFVLVNVRLVMPGVKVTLAQVLSPASTLPLPMAAGACAPAVALTVPPEMEIAPQVDGLFCAYPLPIPAAHSPPVAVTVPPLMVMVPQIDAPFPTPLPAPMPAANEPPVAVMTPP